MEISLSSKSLHKNIKQSYIFKLDDTVVFTTDYLKKGIDITVINKKGNIVLLKNYDLAGEPYDNIIVDLSKINSHVYIFMIIKKKEFSTGLLEFLKYKLSSKFCDIQQLDCGWYIFLEKDGLGEYFIIEEGHNADTRMDYQLTISTNTNRGPAVSIILPTYNRVNLLKKSIRFISSQTYTDYELIVINDGSTDGTKEYLDTLNSYKIKVVHQENMGLPGALNTGLREAVGKYITWTSDDNLYKKDALLVMTTMLDKFRDIDMCYTNSDVLTKKGTLVKRNTMITARDILFNFEGMECFMWRREVSETIGEFDVELYGCEDWDYFNRMMELNPICAHLGESHYVYNKATPNRLTDKLTKESSYQQLITQMCTKTLERNGGQLDVYKMYYGIFMCSDTTRAEGIAWYDLGNTIASSKREYVRDTIGSDDKLFGYYEKAHQLIPTFVPNTINLIISYCRNGNYEPLHNLTRELEKIKSYEYKGVINNVIELVDNKQFKAIAKFNMVYHNLSQEELFYKEEMLLDKFRNKSYNDVITDAKERKVIANINSISGSKIEYNLEYTVLYPPTVGWEYLFQRPQQIITGLSKLPNIRAIFVSAVEMKKEIYSNNLMVINKDTFERHLEDNLRELVRGKFIFYFSHPGLHSLVNKCKPDIVMFDALDNPAGEFSDWNKDLKKAVNKSHLISCTADVMYQQHKSLNKPVFFCPNGCDYEHFKSADKKLKRPRDFPIFEQDEIVIGYYGAHASWVDFDLISRIADKYKIVMVGKVESAYNITFDHPNITWINHKPYKELPYYLSHFDLTFIPFKLTEMIRGCDPIKFYEFCAAGKPVLATRIEPLLRFGDICYFINRNNWDGMIKKAIREKDDEEKIRRRKEVAKNNSWDDRVRTMLQHINQLNTKKITYKKKSIHLTIGIVGYIGFGDYGNELLFRTYKKLFPKYRFVVMHDYNNPPYFEKNKFKNRMMNVDLILVCGGDLVMPYSYSPLYWNKDYLKKPVYINNISVPIFNESNGMYNRNNEAIVKMKEFFNHSNVKWISANDTYSQKWIIDNLSPKINVECNSNIICQDIDYKSRLSKKRIFGLITRARSYSENKKEIQTLCEYAIKKQYTIHHIILAMDDKCLINETAEVKKLANIKRNIIRRESIEDLTEEIRRCDIICSNRYYSCLVAFMSGIPCISLSGNTQFLQFYKQLGCEQLLSNVNDKNLYKKFDIAVNFRPRIKNRVLKLRSASVDGYKKLVDVLKGEIRVLHFSVHHNTNRINLMRRDLNKMCKLIDVDTKIHSPNQQWVYLKDGLYYLRDKMVMTEVDRHQPHIVIVNDCKTTLNKITFETLKKRGIKTIGISLDDPQNFIDYSSKCYKSYNAFFTNSIISLDKDYKKNKNVKWLPTATSLSILDGINLNMKKTVDIVLSPGAREEMVNMLRDRFTIKEYQSGVKDLLSGRIYISFVENKIDPILLDAAACGMVLVAYRTGEISRYFKENLEIILYSSKHELTNIINNIFNDKKMVERLSKNAHQKLIREHIWENRLKKVLDEL